MKTPLTSRRFWLIALLMLVLSNVSFAKDWEELQKFVAADRAALARFGWSVCVDGDYAIVGASLERMDASGGNMLYGAGAAYIFVRDGGTYVQQQKLVTSDRHAEALFGYSVSISGNIAMVGAPNNWLDPSGGNNMSQAGAVYVFEPGSTGVGDDGSGDMPQSFRLNQNFPNPFNPATTITFELPQASDVRLSLFDLLGREISVLLNERRSAGVHAVRLDGSSLASGVYFYRLQARPIWDGQAGDYIAAKKLLMLR